MIPTNLDISWILGTEAGRIRDAGAVSRLLTRPGTLGSFTLVVDGTTEQVIILIL